MICATCGTTTTEPMFIQPGTDGDRALIADLFIPMRRDIPDTVWCSLECWPFYRARPEVAHRQEV